MAPIVTNASMRLFAVNAIMGFILIMDHVAPVIQIVCFAVLLIIALNVLRDTIQMQGNALLVQVIVPHALTLHIAITV